MLGGKLFDTPGEGPYTTKNLDGLRDGSKTLIKGADGKPKFLNRRKKKTGGNKASGGGKKAFNYRYPK